jgi:hypothetical protein
MSRKPREPLHTFPLRIRERLRAKIERAAQQHRCSMNNEIRLRLEDSFERIGLSRSLSELVADLEINWGRFSNRFLRLDLEEQLAAKLAQTKDPEIAALARLWLHHRERERREGGVS